jgi:tetratricopeptide (TPR) repeat protein
MGTANLGDTTGALESYRKALAIRDSISGAKAEDPTTKVGLSRAYSRMGSILQHMGKFTEAQPYLERSLEIRKQLHASAPNNQDAQEGLAAAPDELGELLVDMAQWEPYLEHHRASAALYESLASTSGQRCLQRRCCPAT